MTQRVDVLVVGAGVAGCVAALGLSRSGLDVMLVDRARLPRHKVCGCCLNADAVGSLRELGLLSKLDEAGARPIDRVQVACGGRGFRLPSSGGYVLSRYTLDAVLLDAAVKAGCRVHDETGARVRSLPRRPGQAVSAACSGACVRGELEVHAGVVLVADGLAGSCMAGIEKVKRVARPSSLRGYGTRLPAERHDSAHGAVVMRCGTGGYVGTVVLEDGSLDIAAALSPRWVKAHGGPGRAARAVSEQAGQGLAHLEDAGWRATAPLTGARPRPWTNGVFFLGDAAGYVEPFTGEGMAWAARSATAVLPFAAQAAGGWEQAIGVAWERAYRAAVERRQRRCRLFSLLLRHPACFSRLIAGINLLPQPVKRAVASAALPSMFSTASRSERLEFAAS